MQPFLEAATQITKDLLEQKLISFADPVTKQPVTMDHPMVELAILQTTIQVYDDVIKNTNIHHAPPMEKLLVDF